jgi:hypothetical protein
MLAQFKEETAASSARAERCAAVRPFTQVSAIVLGLRSSARLRPAARFWPRGRWGAGADAAGARLFIKQAASQVAATMHPHQPGGTTWG